MDKLFELTKKSLKEYKVKTVKDLWNRLRKDGKKGMKMSVSANFKKSEDNKNLFSVVFSSEREDRHGDIVYQKFDLKHFKKNPVLLDSHNYRSIENVIGKVKGIKVADKKLQGKIEFAVDNPLGELARNLVDKGFLNTTSIGFRPLEFDDKGNILKSEMLEISVVSVPANPEALIENREKAMKKENDKKDKKKKEKKDEKKDLKVTIDDKDYIYKKENERWDETNEEVRMKVRDIHEFDRPLKRVMLVEGTPKVSAMVGNLAGQGPLGIQMLFFPKSEGWTTDDAKKWVVSWQLAMSNPRKQEKKVEKKFTPEQIVINGIRDIKDTKTRNLAKINIAVKAICKEVNKVEPKLGKKAEANRLINGAIKNLFRLKE